MLFLVLPALSLLLALILGLVVLSRNPKNRINQVFSGLSFSIAFWILTVALADISREMGPALFWTKAAIVGPSLVAPLFLWFSLIFPTQKSKRPLKKTALMFLPSVILILLSPTSLNVEEVMIADWGTDFTPGHLYTFLLVVLTVYMGSGFYNLIKKRKTTQGIGRAQIKYFLYGALATVVLGVVANLILPILGYGRASTLGPSFSLIFMGFTAYAIIKHRLMDIRFALGRGAVYVFSFLTVLAYASSMTYLSNRYLGSETFNTTSPLILIASIILFQPIFKFFEKVASQYFYYTLYSSQTVLTDLGEKLTHVLELNRLSTLIAKTLIETMKLDRVVVLLREPGNGDYQIQQNIGFREENGIALVKDNFLTLWLERTRKPVVYGELSLLIHETDKRQEEENLEKLQKTMKRIEATLCLPLLFENKIIGMIVLGNKISGDPYSEQDVNLLASLANQASIALQNAKHYSEIKNFSVTLEKEVDKRTKELRQAYEKLKELDKMKDEFISIVSHELRTPMTAIQGYLWMLKKKGGELNEKQERYLTKAQNGSERMISLINDMLDVSKVEREDLELDIKPLDIRPLIESLVEESKVRAEKKKLKLEFLAADRKLALVKTDESRVRRVLSNLLDNAIKFTEKGRVTVDAYEKGQFVQINITDTGRGIAKEDLPRLFKKFGRLESDFVTAAEAGGTGLGLYISKALIEKMGGTITIQSEVGKGSTFSITLPAV